MPSAELLRIALEKLSSIPESGNPYEYAIEILERMVYPKIHPTILGCLIFFASVHATIIISCIAVIAIPIKAGKEGRKKNLWIYHKRYVKEFEMPYYLPNSSMGVAITQFFSSSCFIAFIFLAYHSYQSPAFQRSCYLFVWYGFCYLPGYIGLYLTAWTACLTCLTSRGRDGRTRAICQYFSPKLVNSVVLIIPLAVTIYSVVICVLLSKAIRTFNIAYDTLREDLLVASKSWVSATQDGGVEHLSVVLSNLQDLGHAVDNLERSCSDAASGWIFWVLLLLLCYAIAVSALLRLLRQCIVASSTCTSSDTNTYVAKTVIQSQASELKMRSCFNYMVRHCSFMFLAILYDLGVAIVLHTTSSHLTDPTWRSISLLISLVSAMLVSPAMLFQAWRTFTERDSAQNQSQTPTQPPTHLPTIKVESKTTKNEPPKTHRSLRISECISRAILGDPTKLFPPAKHVCVEQVTTQWTEDPHGSNGQIEEIQIVLHSPKRTSNEP